MRSLGVTNVCSSVINISLGQCDIESLVLALIITVLTCRVRIKNNHKFRAEIYKKTRELYFFAISQ